MSATRSTLTESTCRTDLRRSEVQIVDRESIARFRKLLQARHREFRQSVAQTQKESRIAQHEYGKDEGDRANTSLARELDLGQRSRDRALLSAVDAALKRVSEGTFGRCLNCEQEINVKRLEAIPWVRYCITCQELIDSASRRGSVLIVR
jgi:DnaK suppressor protein